MYMPKNYSTKLLFFLWICYDFKNYHEIFDEKSKIQLDGTNFGHKSNQKVEN